MRNLTLLAIVGLFGAELSAAEVLGTSVIPHRVESSMRYRRTRDTNLAARVQIFVKGSATNARFDGRTPAELLGTSEWAWHDLGTAVKIPEGVLTVWNFNGRSSR